MATTATMYDASSSATRIATRTATTANTTVASWIAEATASGAPAWNATAPGVKLCGVVTGALTRASSPT